LDSTGTVLRAANTFGANGLLSRNVGGTSTFYTFDPQGSVCQRFGSGSNPALLSTDEYDAFGARQATTQTGAGDVFAFGAQWGYQTDPETGLLLLTNRYYDPGLAPPGRVNPYRCVPNSPASFADPLVPWAQVRHMRERFEASAAEVGARVEITGGRAYSGYRHAPDAPVLRLAAEGLRRTGKEPSYHPTGGGSDANIFNARGIPSVVVSCGYENAHSVDEYVAFADIRLNAFWCLGLIQAAAELSAEPFVTVLR
jgi:hypothetical protein